MGFIPNGASAATGQTGPFPGPAKQPGRFLQVTTQRGRTVPTRTPDRAPSFFGQVTFLQVPLHEKDILDAPLQIWKPRHPPAMLPSGIVIDPTDHGRPRPTDSPSPGFSPREELGRRALARKRAGNVERIRLEMGDWKE